MKKTVTLLSALIVCFTTLFAQSITVSGAGISPAATLTKMGTLLNGKPYYSGSGTVATFPTTIDLYWDIDAPVGWRLAFSGQPFFTSDASTNIPPGTASTQYTWVPVPGQTTGVATPLSVAGDVVLWVHFGEVSALIKNNSLQVQWTTLKEANNDHFEIQASKDGESFTTIATVRSKAENGNSDATLHYEWSISEATSMMALPYVALLILGFVFYRRKQPMMMPALAMGIILSMMFVMGCSKGKNDIETQKNVHFIRIAQVDKDGTATYSKVIKINEP